jgi:hypothetical protein
VYRSDPHYTDPHYIDPTLHDEIVHLVQNWRKYGLLYKEGNRPEPKKPEPTKNWSVPDSSHPLQGKPGTINFGTDSTTPAK